MQKKYLSMSNGVKYSRFLSAFAATATAIVFFLFLGVAPAEKTWMIAVAQTPTPVVWTAQTSGTTQNMLSVAAVDTQTAWAVGLAGAILKTTNGGTTWATQTSGVTSNLLGITAVDANTAWAIGGYGFFLKTTNGGTTWATQTSGAVQTLRGVAAVDTQTAWAVGYGGVILKTTNGGATWGAQTSRTTNVLYSLDFIDANTAWAVGANGTILKTTNGGATWTAQTSGVTKALIAVAAVDANTAWAAGDSGTILKTTNGGATWTAQTSGVIQILRSVTAVNAQVAWAVGDGGVIRVTTNGGTTWTAETSGTTLQLFSVAAVDANTAWAVGTNINASLIGPLLRRGDVAPITTSTIASAFNVSGWAWADTVGWISFNGGNDHDPAVAGVQTSPISYGVNIDPATLKFSGYAWSDNVGWISFNKSDAGEPPEQPFNSTFNSSSQDYIAKRDGALILGWGKVLSLGERGWLRFGGTATSSSAGIDIATGKFTGWMWNGNADGTGIGWVSLNCANTTGECARSDYAVTLGSAVNVPPDAPVLLSPKSTDDQVAIQSMQGQYLYFKWSAFKDDNQPNDCERQFTIEIFRGATITQGATPIENYLSPDRPDCQNSSYVDSAHQHSFRVWGGLTLEYNTIYTWQAQTRDKAGEWSDWSASASFTTPLHALPEPKITPPVDPKVGVGAGFTDASRVYDTNGKDQTTDTTTGGGTNSIKFWKWDFGDGAQSIIETPTTTPGVSQTTWPDGTPVDLKNPEYTYTTPGRYTVCLTITDNDDYVSTLCKDVTVSVQRSLPIWRRIIPF